jgi:hypothetical protein
VLVWWVLARLWFAGWWVLVWWLVISPRSSPLPCSLISEELGLVLPSTALFDHPTVEQLCAYVMASQVGAGWIGG